MQAAPCTTSPSTLQRLEQVLTRLVEAESEEAILRALDAYLRSLPELSFAQLTLSDGPSPRAPEAAAAVVRTWLLAMSTSAAKGLAPVREQANLDFNIRPGASGQLAVYSPWYASEQGLGANNGFDGLRILTLSLGTHLARVWRNGVSAIAPGLDETSAKRPPKLAEAGAIELEPLRFIEAVDAALAVAEAGAVLIVLAVDTAAAADRALTDGPLLQACSAGFREHWPDLTLIARPRPGELALFRSIRGAAALTTAECLGEAQQIAAELESRLAVRIGLTHAEWPRHGQTAGELFRYARSVGAGVAKQAPPLRTESRSQPTRPDAPADRALRMRAALQRLIEPGPFSRELRVVYQPRVSLKDMTLCGAEALLRWRSPEFGEVAPTTFLPLLEELGAGVKVGEWVLSEACWQARRWANAGLPIKRLAVNLSARQLLAADTAATVQRLLLETGLVSWCELEVEVTESTLMSDRDRVVEQLHTLAGLGVRVAVDDFGLGHTALGWLASFPVSTIKVDRLFLAEVESNPHYAKLARAMFDLGRALNLRVSAEGVETASQLDFVRAGGCEEAQGFYIGRPLEAMHFIADASQLCH